MFVVGTSGHIDHGKTSLILAMTGEDCDRLPEEKAREMTIDIGFAAMELPGFQMESMGVHVDIPGVSADEIYASLAGAEAPLIGFIMDGAYTIDFSAILDREVPAAAEAVDRLITLHEGNK